MSDARDAETQEERAPWWIWIIGFILLVAGISVVWAGARLRCLDGYGQSIFVNVGTALGLAGPLFLAERALARRIRRVGASVDAARTTARAAQEASEAARAASEAARDDVDTLRQQFLHGMTQVRERDEERAAAATTGSFEDLVELYDRAARGHSIDRLGLRVLPSSLDFAVRISAVERAPEGESMRFIELNCEDDRLNAIGQGVVWSSGEAAAAAFLRLAENLGAAGRYPGDDAFDPPGLLEAIVAALNKVIEIRIGPRGDRDVRQIIEVVNDYWAITREGLDSLISTDMWADHDELVGNTNNAFRRLQAQWAARTLAPSDFTTAFAVAERIHQALRRDRV